MEFWAGHCTSPVSSLVHALAAALDTTAIEATDDYSGNTAPNVRIYYASV